MASDKSGAIKACDTAFSLFVRKRGEDKWGWVTCATCSCKLRANQMTAGHLYPRGNMSTRWHPHNALPQCYACQGRNNGEREKMKVAIDAAFGEGTAEEMRLLSYTIANYGKEEIKALAKDFKTKSAQAPQRRHMD